MSSQLEDLKMNLEKTARAYGNKLASMEALKDLMNR